MKKRIKRISTIFLLTAICCLLSTVVYAERIKDIARFEGVRENKLIGYGLIVGLDGTGDKGRAAVQGIINMLTRMGVTLSTSDLSTKSIASVIVTATLPPFAKPGMKLDALVSTIGDAKSIQGGTLLLTPLKGPDGNIYGLAQGPVSIGGFAAEGEGASTQKNHPTAGKIPDGIMIEKEPLFTLGNGKDIRLFLRKPDFTTADNISRKINTELNGLYASAVDPSSVVMKIPEQYAGNIVRFITMIEKLKVEMDTVAKVIINERTGTVIIGNQVKISPVAIAHGSLAIEIRERPEVSQPLPFSPKGSQTTVVPRTGISVTEQKASLVEIAGVTLGEVVRALNTLGVSPRDLISILQALKASGALKAELEII
ncbi:MAG: flagellar basal body P-ring protein FlgI [Nitrospiraceae bacterium]|nr:MAG: flagellar basal body P-ring protein FlgI [Nitrospiraceae bacterium]